jgi:hypothetical protein
MYFIELLPSDATYLQNHYLILLAALRRVVAHCLRGALRLSTQRRTTSSSTSIAARHLFDLGVPTSRQGGAPTPRTPPPPPPPPRSERVCVVAAPASAEVASEVRLARFGANRRLSKELQPPPLECHPVELTRPFAPCTAAISKRVSPPRLTFAGLRRASVPRIGAMAVFYDARSSLS